jgi:dihydroorotase
MLGMDIFLKNALIYHEGEFKQLNIGIEKDRFAYIGSEVKTAENTIDCKGLHIFPGAIDTQVHFREPGLTHKETIESGSLSALHGGITGFFEMPNTKPPTTDVAAIQEKMDIADKTSYCDYAFYAGATQNNLKDLQQMEKLPGVCGIKIFMGSSTGSLLLYAEDDLKNILANTTSNIAIHAEDEDRMISRKDIAVKAAHPRAHPEWRDTLSAILATEKILRLAKETNRKVHVLHITTKEEVHLLRHFKDVATFEITPQHLYLEAPDCYNRLGTLAQMNPPIRGIEHREALWMAVRESICDVIGSDHAPHTLEEKQKPYPESPSGMPGVQTLLPLLLNAVHLQKLSLEQVVELVSVNPIKKFGITSRNLIVEGGDATLTVVNMNQEWNVTKAWLKSKCGWSPFENQKLKGQPTGVISHGQICLWNTQLIGRPKAQKMTFSHNLGEI